MLSRGSGGGIPLFHGLIIFARTADRVVIKRSNRRLLIWKDRIGSFDGVINGAPFSKGPAHNGPRNEVLSFLNNSPTTNQVPPESRCFIVALTPRDKGAIVEEA